MVKRTRLLTLLALLMTAATGAWADGNVACIGTTEYSTVRAAGEAAADGATIKMLADATGDDGFYITTAKKVTLDLNGHIIEYGNWAARAKGAGAQITIIDTSAGTPGGVYGTVFGDEGGKVILKAGRFRQTGVDASSILGTLGRDGLEIPEGYSLVDIPSAPDAQGFTVQIVQPTHSVSLNDGTENPTTWTGKAGNDTEFGALPLEGAEGRGVVLKYNGRLKVKSVTATTDAAPAPGITAARAAYQGTNAPSQDWKAGDKLYVYGPGQALMGTLVAEADGAEAFMAGKLDFTKTGTTAPMTLTLSNLPLPIDYSTQDGKLSTIQSKMNYAMATATATAIDAEAGTVTLDATPTLQPQQALVKLTLQNNGGTAISPSSLTVNLDAAGGYSTINLMRYDTSNEGAGDWIYGGATYENSVITLPKAGGCGCGWKTEDWTEDLTKYTGATCTFAEPVSGNCQFFVAYQKAGSEDQQYSGTTVSDGATYAWVGIPSEATQINGIYFALNDPAQTDVKLYPSDLRLAKIGGFTISPNASEVYIPFKGTESNSELKLNATVSGTNYSYSATGINFAEGSYYEQTVQMTQQ